MADTSCGLLLVDKPAGVTSHDVVDRVRRQFNMRRVGHAGTLDPFATGLLVVLLGRATRLQQYMLHLPKSYRAVARLGWHSTTGDRDGELTRTGKFPSDPQLPEGELDLAVPAFSAIKVDGKRLYKRARDGEEFEPPRRTMTVYGARRMALTGEFATFELECSGGTYVRSVVETLGDAYCEQLVRTRVGALKLEDADDERIVDPLAGLGHLARIDVTRDEAVTLVHGRAIAPGDLQADELAAIVVAGSLIGVGRSGEDGLRPETILVGGPADVDAIVERAGAA